MFKFDDANTGCYADKYFYRTKQILESDNYNPIVTMQVFPRVTGILCGMKEVLNLLKPLNLKIKAITEGSLFKENETVMLITGEFQKFVHFETVYLGILSRMSSIASNMYEIIKAANGKDVIMMSARFERPEMQSYDGYAAYIGGCKKFSTMMNIANFLMLEEKLRPVGTIPHALIAAYGGDTVKATLAFDSFIKEDIPRIALVDFENDCVRTALKVAKTFKEKERRLYGVRLDTSKGMIDRWISDEIFTNVRVLNEFRDSLMGVCPILVREVRDNLDKEGFKDIKIIVSGGFTAEKIKEFVEDEVPFDGVGVGSSLYKKRIDFTADIVLLNGKPCSKEGRYYNPNNRLKPV